MEISAKLVKQLRDKTGAGMMDCKRALIENNGDIEASADYLRKKGLMDASKKSSRTAADGLVSLLVCESKKCASIIELNSETDFVAKNEKFQSLASRIASVVLEEGDNLETVMSSKYGSSESTVKEEIDGLISLVGENMTLRRVRKVSVDNGVIAAYVHNSIAPNMGRIGVLVSLESESSEIDQLSDFGKKIAMHIAAANPSYLKVEEIPAEIIEKEKSIISARAEELGHPKEIAEKMVNGRIMEFCNEVALMNQFFVMNNKMKISDVVSAF